MIQRQRRRTVCLCVALSVAFAWPCAAAERYVRASVDDEGRLRILTSDGRTIAINKEGEQVGFEQIAISDDGGAVGWVGSRENCCTSYAIPMRLVVYSAGHRRTFTGIDLPVWQWMFTDGGKRVAFHQETVHGGFLVHYELRDIASGRLIAAYDPVVGPDNQELPDQIPPQWVKALHARQ